MFYIYDQKSSMWVQDDAEGRWTLTGNEELAKTYPTRREASAAVKRYVASIQSNLHILNDRKSNESDRDGGVDNGGVCGDSNGHDRVGGIDYVPEQPEGSEGSEEGSQREPGGGVATGSSLGVPGGMEGSGGGSGGPPTGPATEGTDKPAPKRKPR